MPRRLGSTAIISICILLSAAISSADQQRRVAVLHFTAVSCGPCGAAALAMERLKSEAGDSLCVVGVHYYDLYAVPEAESLAARYQVAGTPTSWFDGVFDQYYADTATYWGYRNAFDKRKTEQPLAALNLAGWADTSGGAGILACSVSNPAADTVFARLRVAVIERAVYRPWGGGDSVFDVLRGMLPGFDGPELRLAPGADTSFGFPFHISPEWSCGRIEFMAWAEGPEETARAPAGAVLQSARIGIGQLCGVGPGPNPGPYAPDAISAAAFPNPVRGRGTLKFALGRPGSVRAEFYDVSGRRLAEADLGWRGAGEHAVPFDGGGWARGVILCMVSSGCGKQTVKIVKL